MYQSFCTHCGTRLTPQARFCHGCAAAVNLPPAPVSAAVTPMAAPQPAAAPKAKSKPKGRKFSAGVLFLSLVLGFTMILTLYLGGIRLLTAMELPEQAMGMLLEQIDLTQADLTAFGQQLEDLGILEYLQSDDLMLALAAVMALAAVGMLLLRRLRLFYAMEDVSIPLLATGGWFTGHLLMISGLGLAGMYMLGDNHWQDFASVMGNLLMLPLSVLAVGIVLGIVGYLGDRLQRQ